MMSCFLDVFTPHGCFNSPALCFQIRNVYSRILERPPSLTVDLASALKDLEMSYLVPGDFNIHNPASDPFCVVPRMEGKVSASYYNRASDLGYALLNAPEVFTQYTLSGNCRPSVISWP